MKFYIKIIAFLAILVFILRMEKEVDLSQKKVKDELVFVAGATKAFTGRMVEKFPNGEIHLVERYSKGKKDGKWMVYNEEGALVETISYHNGKLKKII